MKIMKKITGMWELIAAGVAVGVFAVVTGIMAIILEKFASQAAVGTTCLTNASNCTSMAYNIIGYGSAALLTMAQFLGIVAITLIGAYIISLLIRQFAGGGKF